MTDRDLWPKARNMTINSPAHTQVIFHVDEFRRTVEVVAELLLTLHQTDPFYAIAGCGMSGVPILGALSLTLGIPMITVRKWGEISVAFAEHVTGAVDAGKYVIVEDLIGTGGTVNRMMDAIDERSGGETVPVGIVGYRILNNTTEMWAQKGRLVQVYGVGPQAIEYVRTGKRGK